MEPITASHILVETKEQAQDLYNQLTRGVEFSLLAQQHSKCPSGRNGGNLGQFHRGQMVPEFETAAFNCPLDTVVGPVQTAFGYHLIKRTA